MELRSFGESHLTNERKNEIIKDGSVKFIDIKPEKEKTSIPTLLAPGWGNTATNLKEAAGELAKERRVITVSHSRKESGIIEAEGNEDMNLEELHKASVLLSTLEKKQISKVDGVGYSEGGLNLLLAAKLYPEKFRNIVLVGPAGMIGKDNIFSLTKRFLSEMQSGTKDLITKPETRKPIAIYMKEIAKYIGANPLKTFNEVKAISESDILDLLRDLRGKGIGISIIHGADDKVFPMDKVQENITSEHVNGFYSVKGGHPEVWLHPEKMMPLVDKALEDLEKNIANDYSILKVKP